jgi:hypothetical protein
MPGDFRKELDEGKTEQLRSGVSKSGPSGARSPRRTKAPFAEHVEARVEAR